MQFVQWLISNAKNIFDPLPKLKLKTFTTLVRKKSIRVRGQEVVLHADDHKISGCSTNQADGSQTGAVI